MKKLGRPKIKEYREYMSMLVNPQKKKEAVKNCKEKNTTLPDEMQKFFEMIKSNKWWLLPVLIILFFGFVIWLSSGEKQLATPPIEQVDEKR